MTLLIFIVVLFVLILVHEWGHFIVAKKTGMRVDEFGIGFPPKLFGKRRGETEYTINLFPIGGFVRIFGEDGVSSPSSPVPSSDGKSDAELDAESGLEGVQSVYAVDADYKRSFTAKPKWAQALVLIAGVTMNVLFAWVLFVMAFMIGVPTLVEEEQASANARLLVTDVLPTSPAVGQLTPESVITGVSTGDDSLERLTPASFNEFVQSHQTKPLTIAFQTGETEEEVMVTPQAGILEDEPDRVAIGIGLALVDTVSLGPIAALVQGTESTYATLDAIVRGLYSLIMESFAGTADYSQVAGPVGIVGLVGDAAAFGLTSLLMFTALISLNLAVINLLPFPALDGGRLLFVAVEALTQRRIDPIWVLRLNAAGFILLILLMVAVTYNDITKIL